MALTRPATSYWRNRTMGHDSRGESQQSRAAVCARWARRCHESVVFRVLRPVEKYFTIVQWDQRGAGRTLRKTGSEVASTMTVDRMTKDGVELAEYLTKHLGKDKIIVVAHSFGTLLSLGMVRARPDLFYAYVGTGQVADEAKNYSTAYDALLQKAQAAGNQQAIDDLKRVGPPPYNSGEGCGVQRKWSNRFEGADEFLNGTIGLALVAPGITLHDINDDTDGQILSGDRLFDPCRSQGPKELGLDFSLPMFVFEGDEDFTTPTALARRYFKLMKAPRKQFVPIHGGHFAMFIHSDEFRRELVKGVCPLAVGNCVARFVNILNQAFTLVDLTSQPLQPLASRRCFRHFDFRPPLSMSCQAAGPLLCSIKPFHITESSKSSVAAGWAWFTRPRTRRGRFVALKFLPDDLAQDRQALERFRNRTSILDGPGQCRRHRKGARTAYQDFFAAWKDEDSDIPLLKIGKAEYEKLK